MYRTVPRMEDNDFKSRQAQTIFLYPKASRPPLGPTTPPIQCVPTFFSCGVKGQGMMLTTQILWLRMTPATPPTLRLYSFMAFLIYRTVPLLPLYVFMT